MRRFDLPLLFILLLGTCTLGSSKEQEDGQPNSDDEEDDENPNDDDEDTGNENTEKEQTGKKCKEDKKKHKEKPKKQNRKTKHSDCGVERNVGEDRPVTSKISTSTRTPTGSPSSPSTGTPTGSPSRPSTGTATGSPSSPSTGIPTGTPSRPSTGTATGTPSSTPIGNPTSAPGGSDMVAIFVPLSIFLLLLVLLVAVFLWRYFDRSQCLRRFRGKDENTVKIKPGSNVITIYATASHPLDIEHPGHVYQEISDVHMGASGPGSSYSTLGFPFQDRPEGNSSAAGGWTI